MKIMLAKSYKVCDNDFVMLSVKIVIANEVVSGGHTPSKAMLDITLLREQKALRNRGLSISPSCLCSQKSVYGWLRGIPLCCATTGTKEDKSLEPSRQSARRPLLKLSLTPSKWIADFMDVILTGTSKETNEKLVFCSK